MKRMIHILEDDEAVRDSLRLVLEAHGYAVAEFCDAISFFSNGEHQSAWCIVMDVNLPGENGLQVLSKLREKRVETPVIIVSGRATDEMRAEAARLRALAFFDKPVRGPELIASIASISRQPCH